MELQVALKQIAGLVTLYKTQFTVRYMTLSLHSPENKIFLLFTHVFSHKHASLWPVHTLMGPEQSHLSVHFLGMQLCLYPYLQTKRYLISLFLWVSPSFQTFLIKNREAKAGIPRGPTWHRSTEPPAQTFWGSRAPVLFDLVEASSSVPWRKERQLVRLLDCTGVWSWGSPRSRTHWVVGMQGILTPFWYIEIGGTLGNYLGKRAPERTVVWPGQDMIMKPWREHCLLPITTALSRPQFPFYCSGVRAFPIGLRTHFNSVLTILTLSCWKQLGCHKNHTFLNVNLHRIKPLFSF